MYVRLILQGNNECNLLLLCQISMPTVQALKGEALYNPITIKELNDATGNKVRIFAKL